MKKDYTLGQGCLYHAHSEEECGCEMMDPAGTIWDYAKKLQDENAGWRTKWKVAVEMAAKAENERDEARSEIEKLREELESHAWAISPAMAQAKIDELLQQRDRLAEALKEIYNVSSFDYDTMPELARKKYREVVLEMADEALANVKGGNNE